ncbi:MAG: N-acetylmuramoyl-L-alanine amidase [Clostridia bacterium]|nr:N-acetylmuramoyl-L-alanine amidase [Clostridia bacterium]
MTKIFLSPSNQTANVGAYGDTNECEQCTLIANAARDHLLANYDCEVLMAEQNDDMAKRAAIANSTGVNFYVAIHTNAFNDPAVKGTETYFHSTDAAGKALAGELLETVSSLTGTKRRSKAFDSLIELNSPICARAYIEVDFHSNPQQAQWIKENTVAIGNAIATAIAKNAALPQKQEPAPKDYTEEIIQNVDLIFDVISQRLKESQSDTKYYRVQCGAFSSKENASALVQRLKNAGFSAIIKYD